MPTKGPAAALRRPLLPHTTAPRAPRAALAPRHRRPGRGPLRRALHDVCTTRPLRGSHLTLRTLLPPGALRSTARALGVTQALTAHVHLCSCEPWKPRQVPLRGQVGPVGGHPADGRGDSAAVYRPGVQLVHPYGLRDPRSACTTAGSLMDRSCASNLTLPSSRVFASASNGCSINAAMDLPPKPDRMHE